MSPLFIKISKDFATLFTTINPIATLALFAGLTASLTRAERRWPAHLVVSSDVDRRKDLERQKEEGRIMKSECDQPFPGTDGGIRK